MEWRGNIPAVVEREFPVGIAFRKKVSCIGTGYLRRVQRVVPVRITFIEEFSVLGLPTYLEFSRMVLRSL